MTHNERTTRPDDRTPVPRRRPLPTGCDGWSSYEGPCGAEDCPSCHPEWRGERSEEDDDE